MVKTQVLFSEILYNRENDLFNIEYEFCDEEVEIIDCAMIEEYLDSRRKMFIKNNILNTIKKHKPLTSSEWRMVFYALANTSFEKIEELDVLFNYITREARYTLE